MEQRRLGNSGLKVSAIGLGTNSFGRTVDGDEAVSVIRCALEQGITFLDCADLYAGGRSEELVGQAIAGRRAEVVLASKCGWALPAGPHAQGLSRRWIMQALEDSLRRLNTDFIDLYQAHRPDPDTPLEETLRAMDDLVRQGKVRYIGCSNYNGWRVAQAREISERLGLSPWISAQNRWNLLEDLDDPLLPEACGALGVGIIPFTPLASGILTGKYRLGEAPPTGTRAGEQPNVRARLTDGNLAVVERLRSWAEARGHTVAELAIAWLLAHPEVSTVIAGARSASQVEANVKAGAWTLTAGERDEIASLARTASSPG
jgi:aryl-alcohol dehydrogenase-like predicted oxidoreductase